jgi:RluA family pseudouridine synthase
VSSVIKLSAPDAQGFWELPVLFEDDYLLALDKPAGLLVSRDATDAALPNLVDLLHAGIERGAAWARVPGRAFLAAAQRLDTEASGILLLAKNKDVLATLLSAFGSEQPGRNYMALAQGAPAEEKFRNGSKLAPNEVVPGAFRVDPHNGKRSLTNFEVAEKFDGWTVMKCEALTDRPHQIRVHLRNLGLPLAGDALYGGKPLLLSRLKSHYRLKPNRTERPLVDRAALHADSLVFPHPVTGAEVKISAPLPKDLTVAIKYLRRYALAPAALPPNETSPS